ncbi:MAG TPA: hypothetical protein VH593_17000, partial [Ktedonobacteraceae bacterium]
MMARYPRRAQEVGGGPAALIILCAIIGTLATIAACYLVFTGPWTALMAPADWFFWIALIVLGSLRLGGLLSQSGPRVQNHWRALLLTFTRLCSFYKEVLFMQNQSKKLLTQAMIVFVFALLMSAVFASPAAAATRNATSKMSTATYRSATLVPNHQIGFGQSNAGPSALSGCGNPYFGGSNDTFYAYTATDSSIHLFDVNRNTDYKTFQTSKNGPAITCWHNNLAVAWLDNDSSNVISTGLFICNPLGCGHGGADIFDISSWTTATSDGAPTFTTDGTNMYLGWVGRDAQHHLNLLELADTSHTVGGKVTFTDYTQDQAGLCFYFNGQLYVSWSAADSSQRLYLATYNPSNPTQLTRASGAPFPDSSPEAPGILPIGGKVYFIWRGSGGNNHIWT